MLHDDIHLLNITALALNPAGFNTKYVLLFFM